MDEFSDINKGYNSNDGRRLFSLSTLEDYQKFEMMLDSALQNLYGRGNITHFLGSAYGFLSDRGDRSRLMASLVDLQLTYCFASLDSWDAGAVLNERLLPLGGLSPFTGNVLDQPGLFQAKLETLRSYTALAFRCRAFWDKYMGFVIMCIDPLKYKKFDKANSRKKEFFKIARSWMPSDYPLLMQLPVLNGLDSEPDFARLIDRWYSNEFYPEPFLSILEEWVHSLDYIRTPEAHGTGVLRKWSFSTFPVLESLDTVLKVHRNEISSLIGGLSLYFNNHTPEDLRESKRYKETGNNQLLPFSGRSWYGCS
jgi:hypothetical protein